MLKPSLRLERGLWRGGALRVAGVDEVGMACLAGPVVAAAVVVRPNTRMIPGVRDSKTLSVGQRERLVGRIRKQALAVGVGAASVAEIERLNILRASHLAMRRALNRVGPYEHALIDGLEVRDVDLGPHTAVVDGDALCYVIACASIVAKVTRDRLMVRLSGRYPGYGWESNVGYATRKHRQGIYERGLTPFHRRGWNAVLRLIEPPQPTLDDVLAAAQAEVLAPLIQE